MSNNVEEEKKRPELLTCPVCHEDLIESRAVTSCGHSFHIKCIKTWGAQNLTCPYCRGYLGQLIVKKIKNSSSPRYMAFIHFNNKHNATEALGNIENMSENIEVPRSCRVKLTGKRKAEIAKFYQD